MNDFEIKHLANHLESQGYDLVGLAQQIRRATNEKDCQQLIINAVNKSALAHRTALDINSESVAKHKLVGVADNA